MQHSCYTKLLKDRILVFPIPANEVVFIEAPQTPEGGFKGKNQTATLEVIDALGSRVYINNNFDGATVIKVANWQAGIYFYSLKTKTNEQYTGKLLVGH